jgi:hypothetical protein
MNMESKEQDWTPVRRGTIYCSPACGKGCTHYEYERVQHLARELADRLGVGWARYVWENLGWHYKAISPCENVEVRQIWGSGDYSAKLFEQFVAEGTTPQQAVINVIAKFRKHLDSAQDKWEHISYLNHRMMLVD